MQDMRISYPHRIDVKATRLNNELSLLHLIP